jgi:hypothetical protein
MDIVGVTGSRHGLTTAQRDWWENEIYANNFSEFHHGDCVGVDCETAEMVAEVGGCWIVAHPGDNPKWRAHCIASNDVLEPRPNLIRDRDIVDVVEYMYAFPGTVRPVPRSGTWYTIQYARAQKRELIIVYPDGTVRKCNS